MSYILDALRKLEEKKAGGEGSVPGPRGGTPAGRGRFSSPWTVLVAVALLLNALFLGWWLFAAGGGRAGGPEGPRNRESAPGGDAPVAAAMEAVPGAENGPAGPFTAAVPAGDHAGGEAAPEPAPEPAARVGRSPAHGAGEEIGGAGSAGAVHGLPGPPRGGMDDSVAADAGPPVEQGTEGEAIEPAAGEGDVPTGPDSPAVAAASVPPPAAPDFSAVRSDVDPLRIHSWAELPEGIKDSLEDLRISGHVYSDDSSFRILTVNDSVKREGEAISPDLRLIEITEKGAIFSYRGTHFLIDDR